MQSRKLLIISFFSIFTPLLLCGVLHAQNAPKNDVILKRDSTRIQALITQMTNEKINYRDLGTADSAKSYIYMDLVAKVYLKSGKILTVRDSVLAGPTPPDSVGQYADMANLPTNEFERSVVMANSDQLRDKFRYYNDKAIDGKRGAIIFTSIGAASLISGLIIANSGSEIDNKKIGNSLAIAGTVVGGGLGLLTFKNHKKNSRKAKVVQTELERRNQPLTSIKLSPSYNPFNNSGMLALRLSF
ncbi:hypothetical protein [Dyadobacter sp. CY312]|uniref:hypothetical protein n=1 Tax=Dyadobacter sp. CY312 TaxID=2907303 RepID=UPI001F193158|nr:hypothetical protein [Dyadobacter sp. CY312]MCE7044288.1 hypothetical protein [Dyadobacter sp. CY312]